MIKRKNQRRWIPVQTRIYLRKPRKSVCSPAKMISWIKRDLSNEARAGVRLDRLETLLPLYFVKGRLTECVKLGLRHAISCAIECVDRDAFHGIT